MKARKINEENIIHVVSTLVTGLTGQAVKLVGQLESKGYTVSADMIYASLIQLKTNFKNSALRSEPSDVVDALNRRDTTASSKYRTRK